MKPNRTRLILILGALTTVTPFSVDLYLPAFQKIADHFGVPATQVALTLSSYFIGMALGPIFYGPLLDRFGRKRPLYFGLGFFVLASIACLFAPTLKALIVCRFFQALGGGVAQVSSTTMVRDFFPLEDRAKVFSRLMLILSVSPLFAPTIGGLLAAHWGWQSTFAVLAGIGGVVLALVHFFLPEGHAPNPSVSLNPQAVIKNFWEIFRDHRFYPFALSGGFAFAGLFSYLAAAPSIFLGLFQLSERLFGLVFALLSVGMIGGGQLNVL